MAAEPDAVIPSDPEATSAQSHGASAISAAEEVDLDATLQRIAESHGYVSNLMQTLALAPGGLAAFAALDAYTHRDSKLSNLQRGLACIIAVKDVHYGWAHYAPLAISAGMTQAQLVLLSQGRVPKDLEPAERAVCDYAFEVAAGRRIPPRVADQMHEHFAPRQIVDVALQTVHAMSVAALAIALQVQTEPPETLEFEREWRLKDPPTT